MATLHLVTGYQGKAHITSADQGVLNAMTVGTGDYVLVKGKRFEYQIISSNAVRIYDGCLMMNGRQVNMASGAYLDATIANGSQGMNRHDIIAIRYEIDPSTNLESVSLVVIQGTATSGTPTDPTTSNAESILDGVSIHDMSLYRVVLEGLNIVRVEPLFKVLAPMSELQNKPNLIINSDFQCNQRGSTSWDVSATPTYSVDMWRMFQVKGELSTNGMKISAKSTSVQGYLTQFVPVNTLANKYTVSLRVDGKLYSFTTTVSTSSVEKDFGKFKVSISYRSTEKYIKVNFLPKLTSYITIGYIDLFEGDIAYTHVKEDPAIALIRCERYLKVGKWSCAITYSYTEGSTKSYKFALPHGNMVSTPIVKVSWWQYTDTSGTLVSGSGTMAVSADKQISYVRLPFKAERSTDCYAIEASGVVSCEPFPDGDS